ncbi:MAG: RNA-binding domain-containing protein [Pseudonocardia sp.]
MAYPLFHPASTSPPPPVLDGAGFRREFPGESQHVEFKQGASEARITRAVVAFSNTGGGVILVGVAPDGKPVGTSTDGEALARLHRVAGGVHDGGRYEITPVAVDGRSIAVIAVGRRRQGFAQTADGQVVVRRDAMNVTLMGAQLAEFVTRNALTRFETTVTRRTLDAADPGLIAGTADAFGWSADIPDRLVEHGLAAQDGHRVVLTVAGALYLLAEPHRELGKTYIEVFRFRDDVTGTEDKRYRISGPLPQQVREATGRVVDEIGAEVVVVGLHRYEMERIPMEVLREAIANAVAHRVYEDNRRCVRIEIRPTWVRVVSPGPLPEPVTVQNMRDQNAARNVDVIAALRRFRLAEDAGRGVDLMQDVMVEQLLDPPAFAADDSSVAVDLPLTSTVTPAERAWVMEVETPGGLKPRDRVLVVHAARGRILTNATARKLLSVDSTHARRALQRLRDASLLVQEGSSSGARYVLADNIMPPPGLRLSQANLHDLALDLARSSPITNQLLRERLSVDRVEALRLLQELVEAGKLIRVGERRGARYVSADSSRHEGSTGREV